ncbi:hypothetical protein EJ03DRAFT_333304 [Teratosphaeria nubilosa]|uniref:Uncharacterized protein n=1 Tax=Teratosphaeria nubilosa TaxID=161662 RepID=A0A6G1LMI7_9PEZI|nr:hypothetical protein EJ03DRAFT_333304 [Teratosphaeria nubilosa]
MGTKRRVSPSSNENEQRNPKYVRTTDSGAPSRSRSQQPTEERKRGQAAGHNGLTADFPEPARDPVKHDPAGHNEVSSIQTEPSTPKNGAEAADNTGEQVEAGSEPTAPSAESAEAGSHPDIASEQWKILHMATTASYITHLLNMISYFENRSLQPPVAWLKFHRVRGGDLTFAVALTGQTESKMLATLDALRAKLRTRASETSGRINMDVAFASFMNSYPTLGLHEEDVESDEFAPATRTKTRTKKKKAGSNKKPRRHEQPDGEFVASPRDENGNQLCRRCNTQLDGSEELEDGYCHGDKCSYRCAECETVLRSWEEDENEKSGGLADETKNYCSAHLALKQDGEESDVVAGGDSEGGNVGDAADDEGVDLNDELLGLVP